MRKPVRSSKLVGRLDGLAWAFAHELRAASALTVVTVLNELADVDAVHVECLGGTLRHLSQGFVGPLAEAALERMTFDRAFLGAGGVTPDGGICEATCSRPCAVPKRRSGS